MFTKTTGRALYREVVNQICEMILSGRIKAGDLLPSEQTLCEEMGVSRTTVREALKVLRERGIIESQKGRGSIVLKDDFAFIDESKRNSIAGYKVTLQQAVQARLLLEPQIAKLACSEATQEDIRQMEEILALCEQKERDGTIFSKDLRMFHFQVAESTHNPVLKSMVELLISMCDAPAEVGVAAPAPGVDSKSAINVSHEAIFEAIRNRREEEAYFYMKENIRQFYQNTLLDVEPEL